MRFKPPKAKALTREDAETIAAEAAAFLTEEPDRLARFLRETGLEVATLTGALTSSDAGVLSACLDYILADESALLVFANAIRRKPEAIEHARQLLEGSTD